MKEIRDAYLARTQGSHHLAAAVALAFDLMQDDPATFKSGYSFENAVLAAADVFDTVPAHDIQQELRRKIGD